jgi:apolipoprotein N-acyltransferase
VTEQSFRIHTDRTPKTWVLLVLSGLLMGLAYPPNPVGLLGSIGLVPLLYALERARSYREMIRWSYSSLLIFSALTSWWVGSWQAKADPFLMISCVLLVLVHPFFFIVPLVIYRAVRRSSSRLYALAFLPFLWCGGEYLHALTDASYPWLTLGNTQTYNLYYIQFIEFTGVWGLSFLLMVQNCAFTAMLFALDWEERYQMRTFRAAAAILAATLVPPFLYGFYVLGSGSTRIPEKTITVTVVQPNENPWDKWKANDTTDHVAINATLSAEALKKGRTDMFLWAENAIPYPITDPRDEFFSPGRRPGDWREKMYAAVDSLGVPVLSGFPDYLRYPSLDSAPASAKWGGIGTPEQPRGTYRWDYFNSAGMFVPGKGLTGAYHKMQLVPFGERVPFIDEVPFLQSMLTWGVGISSWGKGQSIATFTFPWRDTTTKVATVVCFESVYPNVVRKFVEKGANFLTIITNDGWYLGTPGPRQHERFALLRAIETRRSIARAANTGISCFISPYGQIISESPENEPLTLTASIELRDDMTFYTRWGDWWPQLCLAVAGVMAGAAFGGAFARRQRKERRVTEGESVGG